MSPHIINPGHALRLRAMQELQTQSGEKCATGEEWLVRQVGAYLPGVFEEVNLLSLSALFHILTHYTCVHSFSYA